MTQLYDYVFRPWTVDGDRRVVTDEWTSMRAYCSGLKRAGQTARIRVPVDVFEAWGGPMVDAAGDKLYDVDGQYMTCKPWQFFLAPRDPLKMADVRRRLFALIDEYPSVTWLLETSHPENVVRMLPSEDDTGLAEAIWGFKGKLVKTRFNLWLYARCDSQAEADARIPYLLRCPAAVRGLVMTPREDMDLTTINIGYDCHTLDCLRGRDTVDDSPINRINHVIIRGGAEPMHPDWVRTIIRQCDTAGVPVWCEAPVVGRTWNQLPEESK